MLCNTFAPKGNDGRHCSTRSRRDKKRRIQQENLQRFRFASNIYLLDTNGVKDSNSEDVIMTGAKIPSGRLVDDAHEEKSRWCAREFAFAAALDVDNTSSIDLLAAKTGHSIMCFDIVTAFGQAPETELIFIDCRAQSKS